LHETELYLYADGFAAAIRAFPSPAQTGTTADMGHHFPVRHVGAANVLFHRGFPEDVEAAIELNVSTTAPILANGAYIKSRA
jgi:phosphosulfolactate phosphohydrolase-like enzyme